MRALGSRVVVIVDDAAAKSEGGLFLPEQAQEAPKRGKVIAVGLGDKTKTGARVPMDVEVGHRVLFGPFVGTESKIGGQDVLILREGELLLILEAGDE